MDKSSDLGPCPWCGGRLERTPAAVEEEYHPGHHVAGTPLPKRLREVTALACTGCEYMVEVRP